MELYSSNIIVHTEENMMHDGTIKEGPLNE